MCPQANISEILLGGNSAGAKQLANLLAQDSRRTIGGYFDSRFSSPHAKTGAESEVIVRVADYNGNDNVPGNLYLIAGDPSLELQARTISDIANQALPQDAWRNVHRWVVDLQSAAMVYFSLVRSLEMRLSLFRSPANAFRVTRRFFVCPAGRHCDSAIPSLPDGRKIVLKSSFRATTKEKHPISGTFVVARGDAKDPVTDLLRRLYATLANAILNSNWRYIRQNNRLNGRSMGIIPQAMAGCQAAPRHAAFNLLR